MDYLSLITDNTRATDDFINATKLCKEFGKRLDLWKKAEHTQEYMKALSDHLNRFPPYGGEVQIIQTRPGVGTFIHPLLA